MQEVLTSKINKKTCKKIATRYFHLNNPLFLIPINPTPSIFIMFVHKVDILFKQVVVVGVNVAIGVQVVFGVVARTFVVNALLMAFAPAVVLFVPPYGFIIIIIY